MIALAHTPEAISGNLRSGMKLGIALVPVFPAATP